MNKKDYNEDDYCDLYGRKICDNCGKCLEEDGVDIRAINIEEIAKTVEENEYLEKEYIKAVESTEEKVEEVKECLTAEEFLKDHGDESDYIDAFDHIEYLEDEDFFDEANLEDLTEEVFPGVRKLKIK
ncbi:hypothetical protein [Clostridium sp.]|uniref:hypothetical protein n=1 Tax=Clostridium sp. TaxID=1506 RepID=UPI003F3FD075